VWSELNVVKNECGQKEMEGETMDSNVVSAFATGTQPLTVFSAEEQLLVSTVR
jgi:hypothetical protein